MKKRKLLSLTKITNLFERFVVLILSYNSFDTKERTFYNTYYCNDLFYNSNSIPIKILYVTIRIELLIESNFKSINLIP